VDLSAVNFSHAVFKQNAGDPVKTFCMCLAGVLVQCAALAGQTPAEQEAPFLRNIRQLTFVGSKSGEAYFDRTGNQIVFQSVRQADNPFYQIYVLTLLSGELQIVSTGVGRTTCAYFHPDGKRIIFASTHLDPKSLELQKTEIEKLKSGPPKRYAWDFDENFDIFETTTPIGGGGRAIIPLTSAKGYDAECAYSPDGSRIVFCSMRDGDGEIYVMDADGKNQQRLTTEKGYDGGPFFSPDGKQIVWRHFEDEAQKVAEVCTMNADGSNKKQVTSLKAISWAPYFHPTMKWIVFASNHEDPAFEVYAIRPDGKDLTRLTHTPGFDGLPVFSPDGSQMMWTSNRAENRSQLFIADIKLPEVETIPQIKAAGGLDDAEFKHRAAAIVRGAEANNIQHETATLFNEANLRPPGMFPGAEFEDTFFIMGPAIAAWAHPGAESKNVLLAATRLDAGETSALANSALIEAGALAEKGRTEKSPGLLLVAADADATQQLHSLAESCMKPGKTGLALSGFVSLVNAGTIRGDTLVIRGVATSPTWRALAEKIAARHPRVRISFSDDPAAASELAKFVEKRVPCVSVGGDNAPLKDGEPEALNLDVLHATYAAIVDFVLLAQNAELPFTEYDAAAAKAAATASARPYLGTVPEYKAGGVIGVRLSDVREGSPAQNAGLKKGDIIVELAGQQVGNVEEYMKALETLKPGTATTLKYQRDGKAESVNITPAARN
jgi:Tol biopolymer transport system component